MTNVSQFFSKGSWLALLALGGCATPPDLPPAPTAISGPVNLSLAKAAVTAYVDDGRYANDLATVAVEAEAFLVERAGHVKSGEKLAVVFDLDETLLSNLSHMRRLDFGYIPDEWNAWVKRGEAPAIDPVCKVYRTARRLGLDVFLLSGRQDLRDRAGTEKNLLAIGVTDYTLLILKPAEDTRPTTEFKTAARQRITQEGYVIVANLGDQESDLAGGFAERTFKLPDPFYLIP